MVVCYIAKTIQSLHSEALNFAFRYCGLFLRQRSLSRSVIVSSTPSPLRSFLSLITKGLGDQRQLKTTEATPLGAGLAVTDNHANN